MELQGQDKWPVLEGNPFKLRGLSKTARRLPQALHMLYDIYYILCMIVSYILHIEKHAIWGLFILSTDSGNLAICGEVWGCFV